MRDLGLADRLRAFDLDVTEVAGWQTRGYDDFAPRGGVNHHTAGAGPQHGNAPSLGVVIHGRAGLRGPLANTFQARDNTVFVVASGRANHAGAGGWNGLRYNRSVYGNEVENTGYANGPKAEPWRPDQIATMAKVMAASIADIGDPARVCQHFEWAPRRKIDAHSINGDQFRQMVAEELRNHSATPLPDPNEILGQILRVIDFCSHGTFRRGDPPAPCIETLQRVLNHKAGQGLVPDGIFGPATETAVNNVRRLVGMPQNGVADPALWEVLKSAP